MLLVVAIAFVCVLNSILATPPLLCLFSSVAMLLSESVNKVAKLMCVSEWGISERRKCIAINIQKKNMKKLILK